MKIELNKKQAELIQALLNEKELLEKRINDLFIFAIQGHDVDLTQVANVKLENNELLINLKEDGII